MTKRVFLATGLCGLLAAPAVCQPAQPGRRDLKIAMIAKSSANFVFISAQRGAEDAAARLSQKHGVRIEVAWMTPPREDAASQAERVAQAVREGAQAILIACSDSAVVTPAIDAAVAKGVAVMTFDSDAPASKRFAFYGTDDGELGEKLMSSLAELLDGKGKIAVLAGNPAASNLKARTEGVKKTAARFAGIEILEVVHHAEIPQEAAAMVIKKNAELQGLSGWAMVGGWPLFRSSQSPALIADLERRKLKVIAVDGLPDELNYVQRGLVPVLWAQPTYDWGRVGVETIVERVLFGKRVPEKMRMELVRVSRENLGAWTRLLKGWGFTGLPQEYLDLP
jgi:ribose transport system substrate-binding protein